MIGALAASAGLAPAGTRVRARELVEGFSLAKIAREPAVIGTASLGLAEEIRVPAPRVRAAQAGDAIPLAEVYVASWHAAYRGIMPDELLDGLSIATQTARWQKMLAGISRGQNRAWVVEGEGAVRGFVVTGPLRGEETVTHTGEIWAMYLDPGSWRRGLGRALMTHAEADLRDRGFESMALWVLTRNAPARAFYEAVGYRASGETRVDRMGSALLEETRFRKKL